jgi:hypothetical protein
MTAKLAAAPALAGTDPAVAAELQAWRLQAEAYLDRLAELGNRLPLEDADEPARAVAGAIEAFFSDTAGRHLDELERSLFPAALAGGDAGRIAAVRTMQQDRGWIEQDWLELAPQLRAIAQGNHWIDPAEFAHDVDVFEDLCRGHLAREAGLAGPER